MSSSKKITTQNHWLLQHILVLELPFGVVTVSQVAGVRWVYIESIGNKAPASRESFIATQAK